MRLSEQETALIDGYLAQNPVIEGFSQLVRIALLDFVSRAGVITLKPVVVGEAPKKPYFLWDYDVSEGQVHEMLHGPARNRLWLMARILEHARFDEVWHYLTPREIERDLPSLRLPPKVKGHWEYALKRWKRK